MQNVAALKPPPNTLQLWWRITAVLVMISAVLSTMLLQQLAKKPRGLALLNLSMRLTAEFK